MKTIKYGKEKLYITLGSYSYGENLYVGLITDKGEDFCDLSVNIPTYIRNSLSLILSLYSINTI